MKKARILYRDTILYYSRLIHIDRTRYARELASGHGLELVEKVETENGAVFEIWLNKDGSLGSAIPV